MQHEFSPWREQYFKESRAGRSGCVFCDIAQNPQNDEENFVLFRTEHCFGVMNRYPYTLGEFMLIPHTHTDDISGISQECWQQMSALAKEGVAILRRELSAGGVNIGMNLGAAAGAGIAEHIHYHLVPRWARDTNFITTIAHTRVHGVPFIDQYQKLKSAWGEYFSKNPS